jgi:hypothetical protein
MTNWCAGVGEAKAQAFVSDVPPKEPDRGPFIGEDYFPGVIPEKRDADFMASDFGYAPPWQSCQATKKLNKPEPKGKDEEKKCKEKERETKTEAKEPGRRYAPLFEDEDDDEDEDDGFTIPSASPCFFRSPIVEDFWSSITQKAYTAANEPSCKGKDEEKKTEKAKKLEKTCEPSSGDDDRDFISDFLPGYRSWGPLEEDTDSEDEEPGSEDKDSDSDSTTTSTSPHAQNFFRSPIIGDSWASDRMKFYRAMGKPYHNPDLSEASED